MFCFLNILSFLCCWYLVETKHIKEISLLLLLFFSFLNPKILFFVGKEGGGGVGVCAERDVTQEGSRKQTRQSVIVGGR